VYEKYVRGLEDTDKVEVSIPIDLFEHEARDLKQTNIGEFYRSSQFTKLFKIVDRNIKTVQNV